MDNFEFDEFKNDDFKNDDFKNDDFQIDKGGDIMLSEIEFKDVKHIVMDKPLETVIMNRNIRGGWNVVMIPRKFSISEWSYHTYDNDNNAYEFYRARMDSFGFKQFPVLTE